jgi:hypothetical protein
VSHLPASCADQHSYSAGLTRQNAKNQNKNLDAVADTQADRAFRVLRHHPMI